MQINVVIRLILPVLLMPCLALAEGWPVSMPWSEPADQPPEVHPFELPTVKGASPHFNTPIPALIAAPNIDVDSIFTTVLNCYPEKSKFNINIKLVASVKTGLEQYDSNHWPHISEHYIGIVGEMPLYSTTEQTRERKWEHQRRTDTAKLVADFAHSLANRNHAYREIGLYLAMEARAQARVKQGLANVDEQIKYLEKVATSQRDILKHEASIVEQRLALAALCDNTQQITINQYLKTLAHLPSSQLGP